MAYYNDPHPVYCTTCGREVHPDARFCDNCGAALARMGDGGPTHAPGMAYPGGPGYGELPHIPNYLVQAILVTICCCLPAGIVAIVYAAQVNGRVASGDFADAERLSNNAKTWCWISFGVGLAVSVGYGLIAALSTFSGLWWGF